MHHTILEYYFPNIFQNVEKTDIARPNLGFIWGEAGCWMTDTQDGMVHFLTLIARRLIL